MNKISQLLKDHLEGNKTKDSERVFSKISEKLQNSGYNPPFNITKISQINDNELSFDSLRDGQKKFLDYISLDTLAETTSVNDDTYRELWGLMPKEPMAPETEDNPWGKNYPGEAPYESHAVSHNWDKLSRESRIDILNAIDKEVKEQEESYRKLLEEDF